MLYPPFVRDVILILDDNTLKKQAIDMIIPNFMYDCGIFGFILPYGKNAAALGA